MDASSRRESDSALFERYVRDLRLRLHGRLAGAADVDGMADLWERYQALAQPDAIDLDRREAHAGAENRHRARLRLHHRVSLAVHRATAPEQDRLETALMRRDCRVGSDHIRFLDLPARIRSTAAPTERAALLRAEDDALRDVGPELSALWSVRKAAARRLQDRSYGDLFAECRDTECPQAAAVADRWLDASDALYRHALATWAPRVLDRNPEQLEYSDLTWLQAGRPWTQAFDGRIVAAVSSLIEAWAGERAAAIRMDVAERSGKSARPYTAGFDPPDDVWLVARPSGSPRDLEELLHEAGHAIAFVSIAADRPWESRFLAFDHVAETFAFLAGRLVCDPRFLVDCVGLDVRTSEAYASYAGAVELMMIRRYSAKVKFECASLGTAPAADTGDYSALMARAIGMRPDPARAWWETDEELAAIDYLRAWLLEAGVRTYLRREYGEAWFTAPSAIEMLRSWWRVGGDLDGLALARIAGVDPMSIDPLLAACREQADLPAR